MARKIRSADLETRTARLRFAVRKKPIPVRIGPGIQLTYRRNQQAGRWSVKAADGKGGHWTKGFAYADDFEDADGAAVLNFWQAVDRARLLARNNEGEGDKPVTVSQALDQYENDLRARGGDVANVSRVRAHLSEALADKLVSLLAVRDLRRFRDAQLRKGLAPDSVNRVSHAFKAALNLAANHDPRIANRSAWQIGLASLHDAGESRNVILPDRTVLNIIAAAYEISPEFGLLVEVAGVTGARVSQLARLEVQDLQDDRTTPRLMMPSSRKGRGQKKITRRPVPIPVSVAEKLKLSSKGRSAEVPLLIKTGGGPWKKSDHLRLFQRAVLPVGLDPGEATLSALRHSSIVRQLLANTPIRVVATTHDTSVLMIEKTYSKYIADHADSLSRRALLDPAVLAGGNVVPMSRGSVR